MSIAHVRNPFLTIHLMDKVYYSFGLFFVAQKVDSLLSRTGIFVLVEKQQQQFSECRIAF